MLCFFLVVGFLSNKVKFGSIFHVIPNTSWCFYSFVISLKTKILKQVEYESARRKRHINEKTRNRDEEGSTFFLCTFIKGTQGNSKFFNRSARRSKRRKKTQEKGQRGKI